MLTLGIQITDYGIYTVLLKPAKKVYPELVEYNFFPLSLNHINEKQKENELAVILKELSKKYSPHHHHYIFSIPQKQITIHDLKFPFKEKFRINRALPYEISNVLPMSIDKVVYSSKIVLQSKSSSQILTFVANKKWIHHFLDPLHHVGIYPSILTPESSALINLFENWFQSSLQLNNMESIKADQLKIFLSYQNSIVLILFNNQVIQSYNLNWGIENCVKEISEKYKRSMDQSLEYFYKNAFLKKEDTDNLSHFVPLSKIMNRSFSTLSHQIKLLIIHLQSQGYNAIKEIIIFGPGSQIQNLTYHLFNIFKIPVKKLEHYEKFSIPMEYLTALGAGIEGFKKPKNPAVNLIQNFKSSSNKIIKLSEKKKHFLKSVAVIFILFFSYSFIRDWRSSNLDDSISQSFSSYSRKIAKLSTRNISIKNVKNFLKDKKNIQKKYKLFTHLPQIPSALENLNLISQSLADPEQWQLELTQVEIDGSQVILSGFIHSEYFEILKSNLQSIALKNKIQDDSKKRMEENKDLFSKNKEKELIIPKTNTILDEEQPTISVGTDEMNEDQKNEDQNENLVFFYLTFKMQSQG